MKKIVIAADSFKGSISSKTFADVCEASILSLQPLCEVVKIPLGDGGEGTVDALISSLGARRITVRVADPLMRPHDAVYGITPDGKTAIMEMAQASGLPMLAENERNPLLTSTYGTGLMIKDALDRGCDHIMLGIGGSATNDGGIGMLGALGAEFYDCADKLLPDARSGRDLAGICRIDLSTLDRRLATVQIDVACDVDNPFCGKRGATKVFARQKGADDRMIEDLETAMRHFAAVLKSATGCDVASMAGAGAAGGLGGALAAALHARLMPGIDMVLQAVDFDRQIAGADMIITGEGRIDSQTLMGKTPYGVLKAARRQNIPVVAIGGSVDYSTSLCEAGFAGIFSIQTTPVALEKALDPAYASGNLAATIGQIIGLITAF